MPIEGQEPHITKIAEDIAKEEYGMTNAEAFAKGICISCKEPAIPKCYSDAGRGEYRISGMCEQCFDALFADDE